METRRSEIVFGADGKEMCEECERGRDDVEHMLEGCDGERVRGQ